MALINRFEIINFLNSSQSEQWRPDFRHNMFDLNCLSTAIVMPNGTGKTRIVNALLTILSRKKSLIGKTKIFMAPSKPGIPPTHIRIEMALNKSTSIYQQSPISDDIYDTGGEYYVLGICGYKGEDIYFYSYQGKLEETDMIADKSPEQFTFITQNEFREKLKKTRSNQFGVNRQDWLELVSHFIPPYHLKQMADFHTVGGGDKAAELYNIKTRSNERYDQTFFYEQVAPHLLAGVMGPEGEEDEYLFEETIFKSSEKIIAAQFKTREAESRLHKEKIANRNLSRLTDRAREIERILEIYQERARTVGNIGRCLIFLTETAALPGIPLSPASACEKAGINDETISRLLRHIVIVPEQGPIVSDKGLAELFAKDAEDINRNARGMKLNILTASRLIQLKIPAAGDTETRKLYSRETVLKFIAESRDSYFSVSKPELIHTVNKTFEIFEEYSDTGPFRKACKGIETEIRETETVLQQAELLEKDTKDRLRILEEAQRAFEQGKSAFQRLCESGMFNDDEIENPLKTKARLEKEDRDLEQKRAVCLQDKSRFKSCEESWRIFTGIYGQEADPAVVRSQLEQESSRLKKEIDAVKAYENELQRQKKRVQFELAELQQIIKENDKRLFQLQIFQDRARRFYEACPGEKPDLFETVLKKKRQGLERRGFELSGEIKSLEKPVRFIVMFREKFGKESPVEYLKRIIEKRNVVTEDKNLSARRLNDLKRQREFLETRKAAPGKIEYDAFNALPETISKCFLYEVITGQDIPQERKTVLLTLFSSILFAPVVTDSDDARQAVRCLHDKRFPVLVFLKDELTAFIRTGNVTYEAARSAAHTFWFGEKTPVVDCILNPEKIEEEKRVIQREIGELEAHLDELTDQEESLSGQSPDMILAEKANQAILSHAEQELENARRDYADIERELKQHDTDYGYEFQVIISGAKEFETLGGMERFLQYQAKQKEQHETEARKNAVLEDIETQTDALEDKVQTFREQSDALKDTMSRVNFKQAAEFFEKGGENALEELDSALQTTQEQLEVIRQKLRFDFEQADGYTKHRLNSEQTDREIGILNETLMRSEKEKTQAKQSIFVRERESMELRAASAKYDEALADILEEYEIFRQSVVETLHETISDESNETYQHLKSLSEQLLVIVREGIARAEDITALMSNIRSVVRQFAVKDQENRRKAAQRDLDEAKKAYGVGCEEMLDFQLDGFSQVVKSRIRETLNDPIRIISLHQSIESAISEREQEVKEFADMENRLMSEMIKRLVTFADNAKHNLNILRKVCSKNKVATFDITSRISTPQEMEKAIADIIQTLQQRHEYAQKGAGSESADRKDQNQSDLDFIRNQIYRDIFREPAIKIIHPNIRQGKKILFSSDVSTGEQSGVALMMMTRLAEFAKMRYIEATTGSYSARRKLKEQEMGFMLIDGLFSTLSNEEVINNSLESLKYVKGNFQLIGFIHNLGYVPNFEIFPSYIVGKKYVSLSEAGSKVTWVENWNEKKEDESAGRVGIFHATIFPSERDQPGNSLPGI